MPVAIVTGSGGLIGSESVRHFVEVGYDVVGLENDMRSRFFGAGASTAHTTDVLASSYSDSFCSLELDIRDSEGVNRAFAEQAPFIFCSTNKVYGDRPNSLPLLELESRLELPEDHPYFAGIPTEMSIDGSTHSLFGVSKAAADLLVQEYGRYFGMSTVCFRGGCLTGPNHAGAELHGFLSYLMRCTVTGEPYTVFGYGGKQVRDNIHAADLVAAFEAFHRAPRSAAVYNIGGGRESNCSMLEAIKLCQEITGRELDWTLSEDNRIGDHRWWISDLEPFKRHHPGWGIRHDVRGILEEIHDRNAERWTAAA
jgi:CDP-paratose 2-epimerase